MIERRHKQIGGVELAGTQMCVVVEPVAVAQTGTQRWPRPHVPAVLLGTGVHATGHTFVGTPAGSHL